MTRHNLGRRDVLKTSGAADFGLVAGCSAPAALDQDSEPSVREVDRIAADPTDVPAPVDWNEPREHEISMETQEVTAELADGSTFDYMTFDGQCPGTSPAVQYPDSFASLCERS